VDFDTAVAELNALVDTLEREGDERALLLLELVDAIHRPALERIVNGDVGDPAARTLLAMYDLVDVDAAILAEEALDAVRPYIESHGGHVELLDVDGGDVHLRLGGACDGCAGSTMTLTRGIEEALRDHVPGFERIVAHPPERAAGALPMAPEPTRAAEPPPLAELLQIQLVRPDSAAVASLPRPVFAAVVPEDALPPGAMRVVDAGGTDVLLANVAGDVYALRDGCPVDGRTLSGGRLTGNVVVCPWHNCAYDVRSGRRVDDEPGGQLGVVPVAVREGHVQVAVNVA
jgi:Fe-S cluster biogenesis protein NfuA/nitrite reductase/ring-hydroxylating ferredoxin subunit